MSLIASIIHTKKRKKKKKNKKKSNIKDMTFDLRDIEPFDPHAPSGDAVFEKYMHKEDIDYF